MKYKKLISTVSLVCFSIITFSSFLLSYAEEKESKPEMEHNRLFKKTDINNDGIFRLELVTDKDEYLLGEEIKAELKLTSLTDKKRAFTEAYTTHKPFYEPALFGDGYSINESKQYDARGTWSRTREGWGYSYDYSFVYVEPHQTITYTWTLVPLKTGSVKIEAACTGKQKEQHRSYATIEKPADVKTIPIEGAWFGALFTNKTVVIKENPEHVETFNKYKDLIVSADEDERNNALEMLSLYVISKGTVLNSLSVSPYDKDVKARKRLVEALLTLAGNYADGDIIKRLLTIAGDQSEDKQVRLTAIEAGKLFVEKLDDRYVKLKDKSIKKHVAEVLDKLIEDKDKDIKKRAREITVIEYTGNSEKWEDWKKREE
ncbi:MAG: hypothetical protein HY811_09045 [Planctomycetes bacterium]|nr:hypothetical protein [Planctomycetota bacterium]